MTTTKVNRPTPGAKDLHRLLIQKQTEKFLARGGQVKVIPYGVSSEDLQAVKPEWDKVLRNKNGI